MSQDVLFETNKALGLITLNRPQALNALTHEMCQAMLAQLQAWQDDRSIKIVVIRGAGGKAFCAGGDIRAIYESGRDLAAAFFDTEYRLNRLIHHYSKPYIALMDGITMGGGIGVSIHGSHRIATETTVWAMPETAIGLYPDIGSTYFLPRLPGEIGTYLALTGQRLQAADLTAIGVATHSVRSDKLDALIEDLADGTIESILSRYSTSVPKNLLLDLQPSIDRCFSFDTVEEIIAALKQDGSDWAIDTAATLGEMSPTSLKITLRQMRLGRSLDFEGAMQLEDHLTQAFLDKSIDFFEGVRALIIEKDKNPHWQPATLEEVDEPLVASYFT